MFKGETIMYFGILLIVTVTMDRALSLAIEDGFQDEEEDRQNKSHKSTMAPNSKFLNPHLDDATNLQLAIAAFNEVVENASPADKYEKKVSANDFGENVKFEDEETRKDSRKAKSIKIWKAFPLLKSFLMDKSKNA